MASPQSTSAEQDDAVPASGAPEAPAARGSTVNAVLVGLLALVVLAVLPRLVPQVVITGQSEMVGKPAPDVTLPVVANGEAGARLGLAALAGRPVLLDFWSSSCGPCAMVAPVVDRVAQRHEKDGLVVMGVNVDDPPEVVRAYARKKGLRYPMVADPTGQAVRSYGVSRLPSLVLIDRQGKVRGYYVGLTDEAALEEAVLAAM